MNNRQTLYLLIGVTAAAGIGRLYTGHLYQSYVDAFSQHKAHHKVVYETADKLATRREKIKVASNDSGFASLFQLRAQDAHMGTVNTEPRVNRQNNYTDRTFSIEFLEQNAVFRRHQIAHFCFNSEVGMPRIRVTTLKLSPVPNDPRVRSVKPGQDRDDVWRAEITFTQRSPTTKKERR